MMVLLGTVLGITLVISLFSGRIQIHWHEMVTVAVRFLKGQDIIETVPEVSAIVEPAFLP